MRPGNTAFGGSLLPSLFVAHGLRQEFAGRLGEDTCVQGQRRLGRWWTRCEDTVGPATAVRTIVETSAHGLFEILGYRLSHIVFHDSGTRATARAVSRQGSMIPLLVGRWAEDLDRCWRESVHVALASGSAWCCAWNVRELRLIDAARPWGRRFVSFDLPRCLADPEAFALLWALARAEAVDARPRRAAPRRHGSRWTGETLLDEVVTAAARMGQTVCTGLERGVDAALVQLASALASTGRARGRPDPDSLFDQSLTVIYRLLFLLFAEARALVPTWHRTYRESYSLGTLRDAIDQQPGEPGLWLAIQAASRLAREGCRLGSLRVTPFNGHLFASTRAPLAEHARLDDEVLRQVLVSLTTTEVSRRSVRISFADLGVEQLGAIYERVLDRRLVVEDRESPVPPRRARLQARLVADGRDRKASATYYTPRPLTDFIVRRTLAPLVRHATTADILGLRVLDPAMGSGAFLVAACQYLARAYEMALVKEERLSDHEITEVDRAGFRRLIARRCLYGVDKNPMAVQLARLSLWLATLAADVPLTFLDHHLRMGDSLVGATLDDLLRQAPGRPRGRPPTRLDALPLLVATDAWQAIGNTIPTRLELADLPDDTLEQVRTKERVLAALEGDGAALARWRRAADLWCAVWFWRGVHPPPSSAIYADLVANVLDRHAALPPRVSAPLLADADAIAREEQFFHWTLEFPEVFWPLAPRGTDQASPGTSTSPGPPGFDAVFGNPPWAMVREEPGRRAAASSSRTRFVREAGVFAGSTDAHVNLYLLFVDRALQLLRPGGRIGFVVPWGLATDHGASGVRRLLFDRCRLDSWIALDNRRGLFPVHRSLRFLVFTGTGGQPSAAIPLRQQVGEAAALDGCPEHAADEPGPALTITRALLDLVSPETGAVPDVRAPEEIRLLTRLWQLAPPLSSPEGWAVRFGRELNATDDRELMHHGPTGLPVLEGKHVEPFRVQPDRATLFVPEPDACRRLPTAPFASARVAYRDVASSSNQRTLIAAVIPAGAVTTHTLFCCRPPQVKTHLLCALLNSVVANWLVRRWVSTHVTVALVQRLPVPSPARLGPWADELGRLAEALSREDPGETALSLEATLQGTAAFAWGLTPEEFEIVLKDLPLLPERVVSEARTTFHRLARSRIPRS